MKFFISVPRCKVSTFLNCIHDIKYIWFSDLGGSNIFQDGGYFKHWCTLVKSNETDYIFFKTHFSSMHKQVLRICKLQLPIHFKLWFKCHPWRSCIILFKYEKNKQQQTNKQKTSKQISFIIYVAWWEYSSKIVFK